MKKKVIKKKSIIKAISAIYRHSQIYIGDNAKKYNIGKGQWHFLTQLLFNGDGITQEELSEELCIDKANTARAVKKLEEEDYLYREKDLEDGRKNRIYVTQKSKDFEEEFHNIFKNLNKVLTEGFSEEEREASRQLLYKMLDNILKYEKDKL